MVPVAPGFHSHGGTHLSLEGFFISWKIQKTSINYDNIWMIFGGTPILGNAHMILTCFFSLLVLNEGNAWVAGGCRNYY